MAINIDHTGVAKTLATNENGLLVDGVAIQSALVSGTNIKTINSTSLLGSGDIAISGGGGTDLAAVRKAVSLRI